VELVSQFVWQTPLGTIQRALEHPWNKTLSFSGVFQCLPEVKAIESSAFMERAMGIEPTSEAWEANLKARKRTNWRHFCLFRLSSNGFQLEQ
jgi:hypothetical protein